MSLEEIQTRDPAFDRTSFLARAEAVHSLVQRARAEGRPALARPGVSDDMSARLGAEQDRRVAARQRQVIDEKVTSSTIIDASADPARDTIAVRFGLEGVCYVAEDGKPVVGQSDKRRTWAEDWWFQRPAGTTTDIATAVDLEHCLACGAPAKATAEGKCAYCGRPLADPRTWVVVRTAEATAAPAGGPQVVVATSRRSVAGCLVPLLVVAGMIAAGGFFGMKMVKDTTSSITSSFSVPGGVSIPSVATLPKTTAATGYLTPVKNPKVKAPVNDLTAAAAATKAATAGRPLTAIHLYKDGRINFEVQAPDDPKSTDYWTWKGGAVAQTSQGPPARPDSFFSVDGVNLSNLEELCTIALGKVGIPDGIIDHPYLLNLGKGDIRWYIPVTSESRSTNTKTYRVSLDGKKEDVF